MEENETSTSNGAVKVAMKVTIFGATGATGKLLTERCLAAGDSVTVLVRDAKKVEFATPVHVVQGSVFDPVAVRNAIVGADVVLSALGARTLRKEDVLERAVPVIVAAMREVGVRRIIVLGSAGALTSAMDRQPAWQRWLVHEIVYKTLLKHPVASQVAQWKMLTASGLDFTMVLPPVLTHGRGRGLDKVRVDGEALPRYGSRIAREDVADFMMREVERAEWVGKGVYVSW